MSDASKPTSHRPSDPDGFEPPPGWGPQEPWSGTAGGSRRRVALIALAVLAVVAVVVGSIAVISSGDSGDAAAGTTDTSAAVPSVTASSAAAGPDSASAGDTGAVAIVTEDPTCEAWTPIAAALTDAQNGTFATRSDAMRTAAEQILPLAEQTPSRAMRDLYEQNVAYLRLYADGNPQAPNEVAARVTTSLSGALSSVCQALGTGSASARAGLAPAAQPPTVPASEPTDQPVTFMGQADPMCTQWRSLVSNYTNDFAAWRATDQNVAADRWSPQQRAINDAVAPRMVAFANESEAVARGTSNAVLQDLATLAAQYRRAYAAALPTYVPADANLIRTASGIVVAIDDACAAVGG